MPTGQPELELTRLSFRIPEAEPRDPSRALSAQAARAHRIRLEGASLELDLGPAREEDPRRVARSRQFWEDAKVLLESQLPHADKLWRAAAFGDRGAMALSRIGGYLGEGDPPVKDIRMDSVLCGRQLAEVLQAAAGPEARLQAWESHLDAAVESARTRLEPRYAFLPVSAQGECSSYFLEPTSLDWLGHLGVKDQPPGLKAAYLVDLQGGARLLGSAYVQDLTPVAAFWRNTLRMAASAGIGKVSCLYLLGAQNLLVLEPSRKGASLLGTVWHKTEPVPGLLLASRRILRALEPRLGGRPGHGDPESRIAEAAPAHMPPAQVMPAHGLPVHAMPVHALPVQAMPAPGATYVDIRAFRKSLLGPRAGNPGA